ncbi:hypothetical protein SAG0135_06335 [Streptococcus agalactiae LMG 14609]|nr:hypothetical protein SAG0135_06335 [Streptococcus agalactiae LMG 14609]EPU24299.1 hypothetical protein SAG0137_10790 [Streptococcus agalactiae LMG 14838]EPU75799.1 hypothetical protein SAG0311_08380 [Streptococcus agalactiae GB00111]EPV12170.1 hypothetical protein SAG0329_05775 [Streptococcus agalactiae GB00557]EPV26314.1 hypothetical protein SAG0337_04175 [Streptococcus agalactiae GB00654]EPW13310.1 hypothetical protein SAG0050_02355 [Streptococcus agalactiae CCUG 17336]EPW50606.1 hypothe
MAFRKIKNYDDEILILQEGIERFKKSTLSSNINPKTIDRWSTRISRAKDLKCK